MLKNAMGWSCDISHRIFLMFRWLFSSFPIICWTSLFPKNRIFFFLWLFRLFLKPTEGFSPYF